MRVHIGAFSYKITAEKYLPDIKGCTYTEMGDVRYGLDQDHDHKRETVLHELLHVMIDQTADRSRSKEDNEATVASLSPLLFQTLRDNPKLVDFLLS